MDKLQVFNNSEFGEVRVIEVAGKPYFVAIDVARALGYANPNDAITRHCKGYVKHAVPTKGGAQQMNVIPKGDIYRLAAKSELPGADKFESWIFDDVLVSVGEHGAYLTPAKIEEVLSDPDTIIRIATQLKEERQKKEQLQIELDYSKEWFSIKRVAKINDVDWKTFDWRRLKEESVRCGLGVKKIFDANYGEVNTYHFSVWEKMYPQYET